MIFKELIIKPTGIISTLVNCSILKLYFDNAMGERQIFKCDVNIYCENYVRL